MVQLIDSFIGFTSRCQLIEYVLEHNMKLFLVLNENPLGSHDDVYSSLVALKTDGIIESYYIYPFLNRLAVGLSNKEIIKEIVNIARDFQPTGILWSHTGNLFVNENNILSLKKLQSRPSIGYWDGDIYHKFYKPLPKQMSNLVRMCDVSFWPGYCGMVRDLKKKGCSDIRYVPLSTDEQKFRELRNSKIIYDVVMVCNYVSSKIPFKTFPGSRLRKKVADHFYQKLGDRFAVFGNGWNGKYAKGPIPFEIQNKIYHSSKVTLGVNNLHANYYFSNRLPISLSSGTIMVHNYEKGIEKVFEEIEYPYFFRNIQEAWNITQNLLKKSQNELDGIAKKYRQFSLNNISTYKNLKYMIAVLDDYHLKIINNSNLPNRINPWIKTFQF